MSRAARLVGLSVRWLREGDLPSARLAACQAATAAVDEDLVGTLVFETACRLNRSLGELVAAVAVVESEPERAQLYLFESQWPQSQWPLAATQTVPQVER